MVSMCSFHLNIVECCRIGYFAHCKVQHIRFLSTSWQHRTSYLFGVRAQVMSRRRRNYLQLPYSISTMSYPTEHNKVLFTILEGSRRVGYVTTCWMKGCTPFEAIMANAPIVLKCKSLSQPNKRRRLPSSPRLALSKREKSLRGLEQFLNQSHFS